MKVQELAEKSGLTAHTIRFYEKEGLLDSRHVRRDANNYRNYTEEPSNVLDLSRSFRASAARSPSSRKSSTTKMYTCGPIER